MAVTGNSAHLREVSIFLFQLFGIIDGVTFPSTHLGERYDNVGSKMMHIYLLNGTWKKLTNHSINFQEDFCFFIYPDTVDTNIHITTGLPDLMIITNKEHVSGGVLLHSLIASTDDTT